MDVLTVDYLFPQLLKPLLICSSASYFLHSISLFTFFNFVPPFSAPGV